MRRFLLCAACAALIPAAWAGKAHEHGVVRLDIAVEHATLSIALESPLDSLLGFERAPRTAAERQSVQAMAATLKAAANLFRIDPAAGCSLSRAELSSAALKLGAAAPRPDDGHGDLDGDFEFTCRAAPAFVDVALFAAFPRMSRIDVQTATARGQRKLALKRPAQRVELAR